MTHKQYANHVLFFFSVNEEVDQSIDRILMDDS